MPKVRLLEPGFENLTGVLHDIDFTSGVATVSQADAERLATFGRVELIDGNNASLGPVIESSGEVANNFPPVRRSGGYKASAATLTVAVAATVTASLRELVSGESEAGVIQKVINWTIDDATKATIVVNNGTGVVTVTGVAAGATILRRAATAALPFALAIPVTVTA